MAYRIGGKGAKRFGGFLDLTPALNTLHPTPCTLYPTPYTLHSTSYTIYPTPHTLHPRDHPLHPTLKTLNSPMSLGMAYRIRGEGAEGLGGFLDRRGDPKQQAAS